MPFKPGDPNINRSGRPKGAKAIRKYIEDNTAGGMEIIDKLLMLARSPKTSKKDAREIWVHLLDRLIGKPETSASISMTMQEKPMGAVIMEMSPEARLPFLDSLRAKKALGPALDEYEGDANDDDKEAE